MDFNKHFDQEGKHAFLSASKYHWLRDDEEKLRIRYKKHKASQKGVRLHEIAAECIRMGIMLPKKQETLNLYVNDAIRYKMVPELVLYYSQNCFGTADAISMQKNKLRIHDLKSGEQPASFSQLEIYVAIFCLEYKISPFDILVELRIYQNNKVLIEEASPNRILEIMDKIITFDQIIENMKLGE